MPKWLTRDVLLISLSAFFADAGYQALIAGFPIFLVLDLKAPVYVLGIAMAFAYGIGSIFAYTGGILSDRYGKKKIAIAGNLLIPILSFTGLSSTSAEAVGLFSGGWWARNFRSPARRAMIGDITSNENKGKVFGFLNALDVSGGAIAVTYLTIGLYLGISIGIIFLITAIPILISSLSLALVKYSGKPDKHQRIQDTESEVENREDRRTYRAVILATGIYGISFYSLSFPVLTIAQQSNAVFGVLSYLVFLLLSAVFGYVAGVVFHRMIYSLSLAGYILAGIGSLIIGLSYALSMGPIVSYIGVGVIGVALGTIETMEPAIISRIKKRSRSGRGMGSLTASRSIGLFTANIVVGFLYFFGPFYAYAFAAASAVTAGIILLFFGSDLSRQS